MFFFALPSFAVVDENQYEFKHVRNEVDGRDIDLYLPLQKSEGELFPVIVFGHGWAFSVRHYEEMFTHLASRGIAVIHPMYERGSFDISWERMARDFSSLALKTISECITIDKQRITYAGHSKGGYVALFAASLAKSAISNVVVFAPAVFNQETVERLPKETDLTVVWGESDNIISRDIVEDIVEHASSDAKKLVIVEDSEEQKADHYFILTKRTLIGGTNGLNSYHFDSIFPLLM